MLQTIMAVLALFLVTFLAVSQRATTMRSYEAMIDNELEVMAGGIALEVMEEIQQLPFDEATVAAAYGSGEPVSSRNDLSALPNRTVPADGLACTVGGGYNPCNDVSDYHMMQWYDFDFPVRGSDTPLTFQVTAEVDYVNESSLSSTGGTKTFAKEIRVYVRSPLGPEGTPYLGKDISIQRVMTCPEPSQCLTN